MPVDKDKPWLPSSKIGIFSSARKYSLRPSTNNSFLCNNSFSDFLSDDDAYDQNRDSAITAATVRNAREKPKPFPYNLFQFESGNQEADNPTNSLAIRRTNLNTTLSSLNGVVENIKIKSEPGTSTELGGNQCTYRNLIFPEQFAFEGTTHQYRDHLDFTFPNNVDGFDKNSAAQNSSIESQNKTVFSSYNAEGEISEQNSICKSPKLHEKVYGDHSSLYYSPASESKDYYTMDPLLDLTESDPPEPSVLFLNTQIERISLEETIKLENKDSFPCIKNFAQNEKNIHHTSEVAQLLSNQLAYVVKEEIIQNNDYAENEAKQFKVKERKSKKKIRRSNLSNRNKIKNTLPKVSSNACHNHFKTKEQKVVNVINLVESINQHPTITDIFFLAETDYLDQSHSNLIKPIKIECSDDVTTVHDDTTECENLSQNKMLLNANKSTEEEYSENRMILTPKPTEEIEYIGEKPSFLYSPVSENNDYYNQNGVVDLIESALPENSETLLNTVTIESSWNEPIKREIEDDFSNSQNLLCEQNLYSATNIGPVTHFLPDQFMAVAKQETCEDDGLLIDNNIKIEANRKRNKIRNKRKKQRKSNLSNKSKSKYASKKKTDSDKTVDSKNVNIKTEEQNIENINTAKGGRRTKEKKRAWWEPYQRYEFRPRDNLKKNSTKVQDDILDEALGSDSNSDVESQPIKRFGKKTRKQSSQTQNEQATWNGVVKDEIKAEPNIKEYQLQINKTAERQTKRGRAKKEKNLHEAKDTSQFGTVSPLQLLKKNNQVEEEETKFSIVHCKTENNIKEMKTALRTSKNYVSILNCSEYTSNNGTGNTSNNGTSYYTRKKAAHEDSSLSYFKKYEVNWDEYMLPIDEDTIVEESNFVNQYGKHTDTFRVKYEDVKTKRAKMFTNKKFKCDECIYSSDRRSKIEQHKLKHTMGMEYRCHFCNFVSSYNREFYRHMESHYDGPPYRCEHEQCTYFSCRISTLLVHCVMHSNVRGYKCHLCSYSCKRKYHLKGHMVTHSAEKQFLCSFCQKKYKHKCSLVRHLLRHEDYIKYEDYEY